MHPALCERVSRLSYGGELRAADGTALRLLEGVAPGLETVVVDHAFGNSSRSEEEAAIVVERARRLLGTPWHDPTAPVTTRPLGQEDVLVVAPYNAQVALLRRRLKEHGLGEVRVGTVDKFQGQEAPISIYSLTTSSPELAPRGMDFLYSRNRLNVATSRARGVAIVVAAPDLFRVRARTPEQMRLANAFCRFAEYAAAGDRSAGDATARGSPLLAPSRIEVLTLGLDVEP
jgi:uncharacterized protein